MTIGLDYDKTITRDIIFWYDFLRFATEYDHKIVIVTSRRDTEENRAEIEQFLFPSFRSDVPIVFCSLKSKIKVCQEQGYKIDVWIDDDPDTLVNGH